MFNGQNKNKKRYADTYSGHVVEKISMETCSLKADV
jgi:hypothetical protein